MLTECDDSAREILRTFFVERSEESFCAVFKLMFPKLKRYLTLCGGPADIAEQLAIDSLYTVYARVGGVREPSALSGWIFKIARNELLQYYRRTKLETNALAALVPRNAWSGYLDGFPEALELREWLACLDEQGREIMLLRFVEGLEYHEIAAAVSIPLGTVKWKIFDCKLKLARSLGIREKV